MYKHILLLILCSVLAPIESENLFLGYRTYDDYLLFSVVEERSPVWFAVRSSDLAYPGFSDYKFTITAINITDIGDEEDSGFADVDYGGVGLTYANIHLRSDRGKGFKYIVEIYGVEN